MSWFVRFRHIKLTYSIGVYIVNDRKMDLRQIEDRAAMARKKAKGNMMNNVLYYQEEFKEMLYIRNFIEESLPSAIDEKQFQMYLQPKYSIVQNHIVGAEALVRWQHPSSFRSLRKMAISRKWITIFGKRHAIF